MNKNLANFIYGSNAALTFVKEASICILSESYGDFHDGFVIAGKNVTLLAYSRPNETPVLFVFAPTLALVLEFIFGDKFAIANAYAGLFFNEIEDPSSVYLFTPVTTLL